MTFKLLEPMHGAYCPYCGERLKPISIKAEDKNWYKAWGCKCVATPEEIAQWEAEIKRLREAKATA
jgi:hypothetical protein